MIQLYAKISDLSISEITSKSCDEYIELEKDIRANGIKDSLMVKPNGGINRGNTRLTVAETLGMTFLPVDVGHFIGLTKLNSGILLRESILDAEIRPDFNINCRPVHPPVTDKIPFRFSGKINANSIDANLSDDYIVMVEDVNKMLDDAENNKNLIRFFCKHCGDINKETYKKQYAWM